MNVPDPQPDGVLARARAGVGFLTLRNARDLAVCVFVGMVVWKLLFGASLAVDLGEFKFTDFLALLLALFSVWLSVLFYFKADEASGRFYDNSYRFTREMGEILGRIEAGFGERLRHLDEGYTGLRDAVGKFADIHQKVQQGETTVEEKTADFNQTLSDLADKAKLADNERLKVIADLERKGEELNAARAELKRLRALEEKEKSRSDRTLTINSMEALAKIADRIVAVVGQDADKLSHELLHAHFKSGLRMLDSDELLALRDDGLVGRGDSLTLRGNNLLRTSLRGAAAARN